MFRSPSQASAAAKAKPRSAYFKNRNQVSEDKIQLENGITMPKEPVMVSKSRPSTSTPKKKIDKKSSKHPNTLKEDAATFLANEENVEVRSIINPIDVTKPISKDEFEDLLPDSSRSTTSETKPSVPNGNPIPLRRLDSIIKVTNSSPNSARGNTTNRSGVAQDNTSKSYDSEFYEAATPIDHDSQRDKDGNSTVRLKYLNEVIARMDHNKKDIFQLVQQIDHETYRMKHNIDIELTTCKKLLEGNLIKVVEEIAQNKLPEVYLRSIPKFGGNNVTLALHKSLEALKRATETAKGNALTVKFDEETTENLGSIIYASINTSLAQFINFVTDMNEQILRRATAVIERKQDFENVVLEFKNENMILIEKLEQTERELEAKNNEVENYRMEFKEKELQMDILRDQVNRRNDLLDEQRKSFHTELLNLKMQLYQQTSSSVINVGTTTTQTHLVVNSAPPPPQDINFTSADQSDIQNAMRVSQKEFEEKMEKHMKEMKDSFVREKRSLMLERKHALEMKDNEIAELKRKLKRAEEKLKGEENVS